MKMLIDFQGNPLNQMKRGARQWNCGYVARKPKNIKGSRLYVRGYTVNQVKKILGKLAKKVRLADKDLVEVVHTSRRHTINSIVYRLNGYKHPVV